MTRGELTDELTAGLGGVRHEARFIVDEVLIGSGAAGLCHHRDELPASAVTMARRMAARRAAGEPLQYVFGHWSFRHLDLLVDQRVLIPRPETEQVVEVALAEGRRLHKAGDVGRRGLVAVDAGTGSGAIALALATELGARVLWEVWAIDASADALEVATANLVALRRCHADLPPMELVEGNWLEALPEERRGAIDLVVANPPYVSEEEWAGLAAEVRSEPRQALVAGPASDGTRGLADVEALLEQCRLWLTRPGTVVVELAPGQAGPALRLAQCLGYDDVRVEPDLSGRPRALVARAAG